MCEGSHVSGAVETDKEEGQGVLGMTLGVAAVNWHGCHHVCRTELMQNPKNLNDFVLSARLSPCIGISNEGSERSGLYL